MIFRVSPDYQVRLDEPDNFRQFHIEVGAPKGDTARLDEALGPFAEREGDDTAWVSEAALRAWPGQAQDAAWQDSLSAMIEKARPHGWIDDERKAIKAHIEWAGD